MTPHSTPRKPLKGAPPKPEKARRRDPGASARVGGAGDLESSVASCARELREAIVSGAFPPGLRLPPERALAERFGVNRGTVRAALGLLDAEHLVSARQGSGYTVHDFRREAGPDLIGTLLTLAQNEGDEAAIVRDLLMVRRQLARVVLERLFEAADAASTDAVEAAIDRFESIASSGATPSVLARADLDVVAALVAATRSLVLALCLNPVASVLAGLPRLQQAMYREPAGNVLAFRAVLAWLRKPSQRGLDVLVAELGARDERTVAHLREPFRERASR